MINKVGSWVFSFSADYAVMADTGGLTKGDAENYPQKRSEAI